MTPLLAAPLLVAVTCLYPAAQDPKPPVTPLEGEWREPLRPSEKAGNNLVVVFAGEEITLVLQGMVFGGTVQAIPDREPTLVGFTITRIDAKGERLGRTHSGRCLVQGGQLFLQVTPPPAVVAQEGGKPLELAPITFRLEKLKK